MEAKYISKYESGEAVDEALDTGISAHREVELAKGDSKGHAHSSLKNRIDSDVDQLQAQIDQIVRAPESGGDVAAEVAQARVDADGTTYQTLKERLDAEETGVEQAIIYVTPFDIEQGVWENGAKVATTHRIRVNKKLHLRLGSELSINPHGLFISVHQYADESATEHLASGWIGGDDNIIDIQIERPVVTISIANTGSYTTALPITPSDYTCTIYAINTNLPGRISTLNADINEITGHLNDNDELLDIVNISSNIPENLFDFRTALNRTAIRDTGEIIPNDLSWITDYISIPEGAGYLKFSKHPRKTVFFDSNKNYISQTPAILLPVPIPDNAAYFISMWLNEVVLPKNVWIVSGNTDVSYLNPEPEVPLSVHNLGVNMITSENLSQKTQESLIPLAKNWDINLNWENGSIYPDNGKNYDENPVAIRTKYIIWLPQGLQFYTTPNYRFKAFRYTANSDYISTTEFSNASYLDISESGYYRIIVVSPSGVSTRPSPNSIGIRGSLFSETEHIVQIASDNMIRVFSQLPFSVLDCTRQTIDAAGIISVQPKRILSPMFTLPTGFTLIFGDTPAHIARFNADSEVIYFQQNLSLVSFDTDAIIRFAMRKADNTDITDAEMIELYNKVQIVPTGSVELPFKYYGEKIVLENRCQRVGLGSVGLGQDGCLYNDYFFAFSNTGHCKVSKLFPSVSVVNEFDIAGMPEIQPHCNSVVFSHMKYDPEDVFPLIYLNAYNTPGLPKGTVYVHRVITNSNNMPTGTQLIQTITVGFTDDPIWSSGSDARPYGNFFIDTDKNRLYAYTLRDAEPVTRFFQFDIPDLSQQNVTLAKSDILDTFDIEHMRYIQGNAYFGGKVYITHGIPPTEPGAIKVVDLVRKTATSQIRFIDILSNDIEPEFIDISGNSLITGMVNAIQITF